MAEHAKTKNKGPVPGEILPADGFVELNVGRRTAAIVVCNAGDRPIQVGSHYHFFEVNRSLEFSRAEAFGFRLDIPAGTAVRFEPGEEKEVQLVEFGGERKVLGLNGLTDGNVEDADVRANALKKASQRGFVRSNTVRQD